MNSQRLVSTRTLATAFIFGPGTLMCAALPDRSRAARLISPG